MSEYSRTITRRAPAAVNPVTAAVPYKNRVMLENGVAGEAVLSGAAGGTVAVRPIGICVEARNELGGELTIVVDGFATGIVGAANLTAGAQSLVEADANGALVTSAVGGAVWSVGTYIPERNILAQAGGTCRVLVNPIIV